MTLLSGYLLATGHHGVIESDAIAADRQRVPGGPVLHVLGQAYALAGWDRCELVTSVALTEDDEAASPPYRHQITLVRGYSKLVLLAQRKRIADYVLRAIFDAAPTSRLRKVAIPLDEVVRHCKDGSSPFLVTTLIGRFSGPARELRTISLHGDDVTASAIYEQNVHLFNVTTCGMGRRLFDGLPGLLGGGEVGEILRLGNDGSVSASIADRDRAAEFAKVIRFVVSNHWMESWVPRASDPGEDERLG